MLGVCAGGILLVSVLMPVSFPWVLRPLAGTQGVPYELYRRIGYPRFAVSGLTLTNGSTIIRAERLEALVPSAWLRRLAFSKARTPFAQAENWELAYGHNLNPRMSVPSGTLLFSLGFLF